MQIIDLTFNRKFINTDSSTLNKEVWLIDKIKRLANLTRIQQEALLKGQCGVAIKAEKYKSIELIIYFDNHYNK